MSNKYAYLEIENVLRQYLPYTNQTIQKKFATSKNRPIGVLLIEGNPLLRTSLEHGLRKHGLKVWAVADALNGIALYDCFGLEIDIVLTDVQTSDLTKYNILEVLRVINPWVQLCFVTSDVCWSKLAALKKRGATCVLVKPLPPIARLIEMLQELTRIPDNKPKPTSRLTISWPHGQRMSSNEPKKVASKGIVWRIFSSLSRCVTWCRTVSY